VLATGKMCTWGVVVMGMWLIDVGGFVMYGLNNFCIIIHFEFLVFYQFELSI